MITVFGVETSCLGQRWCMPDFSDEEIRALMRTGVESENFAKMLAVRGVRPDEVPFFMDPRLKDLPDPVLILKQADVAAKRIADAVIHKEKIGIFGDYDVDGITSTTLIYTFLKKVCDEEVFAKIPERDDGYGPTPVAMQDFVNQGVKLVVTVDCGTSSYEAFAAIPNTDIVVIDHHEQDGDLPQIVAVVNPKRTDEYVNELTKKYYPRDMAAVGVVFMVLVALNRELRTRGWYGEKHQEPDLRESLDLVALGTVCDVMKLHGINRLFVKYGLQVMSNRKNNGLNCLQTMVKVKDKPTSWTLSHLIGPRLNAGGRIGSSNLGFQLLCSENMSEANGIVLKLEDLNTVRRDMCSEVLKQAIVQVEQEPEDCPIVFAYGKDWHHGVIGIIAGKLKDRYKKPALVMCGEAGDIHGSGRSVPDFDLGAAIFKAKEMEILLAGGGHTLAAGFSLTADKIDEFKSFIIEQRLSKHVVQYADLNIDAALSMSAANADLLKKIETLEPYGEANPEPMLALADVMIISPRTVGSGHVSCRLRCAGCRDLSAIAYNSADSDLGVALLKSEGVVCHVAGTLHWDTYHGEGAVQFYIEDVSIN